MLRIFALIIYLLVPFIVMSQNDFNIAVKQLFYNVEVKLPIEVLINEFSLIANNHKITKEKTSLSTSFEMNSDTITESVLYIFEFSKSPLPNMIVDSGLIKMRVGRTSKILKLLDIDWSLFFLKEHDAEVFFKELKRMFLRISTKHKFGSDTINSGKFAEFSVSPPKERGINDITFLISETIKGKMFEINMVPYSSFME